MNSFDDLRAKYPRLISSDFGFECGIGWLGILDRYFGEVDALLPADIEWSNRQIKEKFGTLRLYCEALWPGKEPTALFAIDVLNVGLSHRREGDDGEYAEIDKKLVTWPVADEVWTATDHFWAIPPSDVLVYIKPGPIVDGVIQSVN